ncbi:MAG: hypothetical protein AB8B57_03095 [Congregibacter sp.]
MTEGALGQVAAFRWEGAQNATAETLSAFGDCIAILSDINLKSPLFS